MNNLSHPDPVQLVQRTRVHRRVYCDPAIFELEMERIFARAWVYVGHESRIPQADDFVRSRIGIREILLVRQQDGGVRALLNRCAHRGAQVCRRRAGRAKFFRCPYHGWSYRPDGSLLAVPHEAGYGPGFDKSDPVFALAPVPRVESYRGFVFASLAAEGPSLTEYLGPMTRPLDNMIDRAPEGALEMAGGSFRQIFRGNWKLHMENANDLVHPVTVHASSVRAARDVTGTSRIDASEPQEIQMVKSNGLPISDWDAAGVHGYPQGHCWMGGFYKQGSIAATRTDPEFEKYRAALVARLGRERTEEVLGMDRYNNLIYPNLSVNSRFQQIRVIQPLAVDRTLVESACFRLKGAPPELFRMAVEFLTAVNSPASLISSDDLEIFQRCQAGLATEGMDWIDLSRGSAAESVDEDGGRVAAGTSELPIRTQMQAWLAYMREGAQ
jgi:phenylpropionate dioxygenase-like ring-hydroxylating dioxygenase large terminal subunit